MKSRFYLFTSLLIAATTVLAQSSLPEFEASNKLKGIANPDGTFTLDVLTPTEFKVNDTYFKSFTKYFTSSPGGYTTIFPKNDKLDLPYTQVWGGQKGNQFNVQKISMTGRTSEEPAEMGKWKKDCLEVDPPQFFQTSVLNMERNDPANPPGLTVCISAYCQKDTKTSSSTYAPKNVLTTCKSIDPDFCRALGNHFYSHLNRTKDIINADDFRLSSNKSFKRQSIPLNLDPDNTWADNLKYQNLRLPLIEKTASIYAKDQRIRLPSEYVKKVISTINEKDDNIKKASNNYAWAVDRCLRLFNKEFISAIEGTEKQNAPMELQQ